MKGKLLLILVIALITSCAKKNKGEQKTSLFSYFVEISETEDLGVKDVLGFYGGQCEYSIGRGYETDKGKKIFFELKISQSEGLLGYSDNLDFAANNIAYRFYRNLSKEEKKEYTHINSVVVNSEGVEREFEVSTWELELVHKKMSFVDSVIDIIREKKFDDLTNMLNDSTLVSYDRNELIGNLKKFDPQFGNVTDEGFRIFGYRFQPLDDQGNEALFIAGAIMRDVQANEFSIVVDPYSEKKEILLMQYKM